MTDYEKTFDEFWRPLVTREDGSIDLDAVKRELHDYRTILEEVPKVYMHVTGDKISKPNTEAMHVIAAADEHFEWMLGTTRNNGADRMSATEFRMRLDAVTAEVEAWPIWKQNIIQDSLSPTVPEARIPVDNAPLPCGPLNVADPVQHAAEEYLCAMQVLDDREIPRQLDGKTLSLVGRIFALEQQVICQLAGNSPTFAIQTERTR